MREKRKAPQNIMIHSLIPRTFTCVDLFDLEISKTVDMYMFLFDDILLLTKVKKPARKVGSYLFM